MTTLRQNYFVLLQWIIVGATIIMVNAFQRPKLIVFDLDNTVWTPELYRLRNKHKSADFVPVAHQDIHLFPGFLHVLERKRNTEDLRSIPFAIASRTQSVEWAQDLLQQFQFHHLLDYVEIFPGNKKQHFRNIADASGIAFSDMIFYDDARDGSYGNCVPVAEMGVLSVHCPDGLTVELFEAGLSCFQQWDRSPGTVVERDGTVSKLSNSLTDENATKRSQGRVNRVINDKSYGFIRPDDRNMYDLFFHFSSLPDKCKVEPGNKVSFLVEKDPANGKNRAVNVVILSSKNPDAMSTTTKYNSETIEFHAFSMNMPFAALLANGYKTLETRNNTMFVAYPEGTQLLLHVGRRIYPDSNRHLELMRCNGLDIVEIEKLKALPKGFGPGMVVAICELGRTFTTSIEERSEQDFQSKVVAYGTDSGRYVTEIRKVVYLKRAVTISGQGGVFKVVIESDILPDNWKLPAYSEMPAKHST